MADELTIEEVQALNAGRHDLSGDFPPAPPLAVAAWLQGGPLTLDELRGRPVLLHLFSIQCPGCVARSIPHLNRLHELLASSLAIVGINTVFEHPEHQTAPVVAEALDPLGIDYPVALDQGYETARRFKAPGTPTHVIIDPAGRVRRVLFGSLPANLQRLDYALQALLGEQ